MNIREIYTKAIVAKGKKLSKNSYTFKSNENVYEILSTYIANHKYEAVIKNKVPKVIGQYDLFIFVSLNDGSDTSIIKNTINYIDEMQVNKKEDREYETSDTIKARCMNYPKVLSTNIEQNNISVEIEKEMQIEISGETCIKVEVKNDDLDELEEMNINSHFIQ